MIELNCSSGYEFGFNTFHLRNTGSNAFFTVELVGILFGLKKPMFFIYFSEEQPVSSLLAWYLLLRPAKKPFCHLRLGPQFP